jgi:pilus assembly protein CpaC
MKQPTSLDKRHMKTVTPIPLLRARAQQLFYWPAHLPQTCISLAFACTVSAAWSQGVAGPATTPPATSNVSSDAEGPQRNVFVENLRPGKKTAASLKNQPYRPIKPKEDAQDIPELDMFVGESRVFPTPGVSRIAVGNGQILSAAPLDGKEVILFANGVGTSSLFVWNENGQYQRIKINIVAGDTTRIAREIAAFLKSIPSVRSSIIGDKVIIEGDNLSDFELTKIDQLSKRYPQIVNFTDREVGWEQMVMFDLKVVEFPKNELREIGLKWNSTGGAAIGGIWSPAGRGNVSPYVIKIPSSNGELPIDASKQVLEITKGDIPLARGLAILSGINLGIQAQLNLLVQNGKATVLAEPQLSARSGAKASFLAGGEVAYSATTTNGATQIVFKPYGVRLDIEPKVDRNGTVRAIIDSEVSSIDGSIRTTAGPALLSRKTKTEINVKNGDTFVLAGFLSRRNTTTIDKVPFLGDIPIIGELFKSRRFQNDETELVIFVTPRIVSPFTPELVQRVQDATQRLELQSGPLPAMSKPLSALPASTAPVAAPTAPAPVTPAPAPAPALPAQNTSAPAPAVIQVRPVSGAQPPSRLAVSAAVPRLQVRLDGLALRERPSDKSALLMQLGKGSVLEFTGLKVPSTSPVWHQVNVNGQSGWVASQWVAPTAAPVQMIPFGAAPAISKSKPSTPQEIPADHPVVAQGDLQADLISAAAAQPQAASSTGALQVFRVAIDRLPLRTSPELNAQIVAHLPTGAAVLEARSQAPKGQWLYVQAASNYGWVNSHWLIPAN